MKPNSQHLPGAIWPNRARLLRRELIGSQQIPYTAHVDPYVVRTKWGDYVQVFRLGGVSFQAADDDQLNTWHERLALCWRNIAAPNLAVWTHIVRRRERYYPEGEYPTRLASDLNERYRKRLAGERKKTKKQNNTHKNQNTTNKKTEKTAKVRA